MNDSFVNGYRRACIILVENVINVIVHFSYIHPTNNINKVIHFMAILVSFGSMKKINKVKAYSWKAEREQ